VCLGDYPRAIVTLEMAFEMFKELGDTVSVATSAAAIAQLCVLPQVAQPAMAQKFMKAHRQMQAAMSPVDFEEFLKLHL